VAQVCPFSHGRHCRGGGIGTGAVGEETGGAAGEEEGEGGSDDAAAEAGRDERDPEEPVP
jgi:hypothetical protein